MRRLPFSRELVGRVYAGQKTQTRRPLSASVLGKPGDVLLVAEPLVPAMAEVLDRTRLVVAAYALDRELVSPFLPWKNPACRFIAAAYMPAAAGRRRVRLVDVWEEPAAAISEEDAVAEGVDPVLLGWPSRGRSHRAAFVRLWDRVYPGVADARAYRFELLPVA